MFARGIQRSLCFVSISNSSVFTSNGTTQPQLVYFFLCVCCGKKVRVCCAGIQYTEKKNEKIKECQPSVKNFFIYFQQGDSTHVRASTNRAGGQFILNEKRRKETLVTVWPFDSSDELIGKHQIVISHTIFVPWLRLITSN